MLEASGKRIWNVLGCDGNRQVKTIDDSNQSVEKYGVVKMSIFHQVIL